MKLTKPTKPFAEYSLLWTDNEKTTKDLKNICGSPRRRLKTLEAELDNLCKTPHVPESMAFPVGIAK